MKTLVESILSSNGAGMEALVKNWWERHRTVISDFVVKPTDGGFNIIQTDWHKSPQLYSYTLDEEGLKSMPKGLKWVYLTYPDGAITPTHLHINNTTINELNLSHMNFNNANKVDSFFDPVTMHCCKIGKITGFVQHADKAEFRCGFEPNYCRIGSMENVNVEFLWLWNSIIKLDKIKNCKSQSISFGEKNLRKIKECFIVNDDEIISTPFLTQTIDDLLKDNEFTFVNYHGDIPGVRKKQQNYKVIKQDDHYIFVLRQN